MSGIGDFLKGAGGGALAGGGLGGPLGAILGGLGGGLAGILGGSNGVPGSDDLMAKYNALYGQMSDPNQGQAADSDFRGQQKQLSDMLMAQAQGKGPSLAGEMLKSATDRNVAQQQAMSQSGMGNATMAAQGAASNTARLGAQAGQDAAAARIAEQQMALQQLGGVLQGARGQDLGLNMFNADARRQLLMGRGQLLGQMGNSMYQNASVPSLGDQLLAGGAGLYSMGASQRAQARAGQGGGQPGQGGQVGGNPFGGPDAGNTGYRRVTTPPGYVGY